MKKYNQYNKIYKNKIIKQYDTHFTKSAAACARQRLGGGGGVTKDRKGMLITENYKNVHSGHGQCFMGETLR
jgi:hypothetical protein